MLYLGIINYNNEFYFVIPNNMIFYIEIANTYNNELFKKIYENLDPKMNKIIKLQSIRNSIDLDN